MLKVGVLLGGKSIEREVSLNSGRTICDHLDTQLFEVLPIFQTAAGDLYLLPWSFLYRGKIADFEHRLEKEAQKIIWDDLPSLVDFMYIATHGKYAEDGRLQAMLELLKIPYLGSKVFGSSLGMNKLLHNHFLHFQGIETPKCFGLTVHEVKLYDVIQIQKKFEEKNITFPVVVKPQNEGSSFGVFVVHGPEKLQEFITKACFISGSVGQGVLIEEKIVGMEFTCIILTDYINNQFLPLPPTEILLQKGAEIFDYQQKYMPGAANERTPASCSAQDLQLIQDTCVKAMQALQFTNMARIDGFLTADKRVIIIDSNPLSGMGPATFLFRQAAEVGIGHGQLINHLIKTELKSYNMEKQVKKQVESKKIRVAVLLGGPSNEKETSFNSGRNVCYKLSPEKYDVTPVFVDNNMKLHILDNRLLVHTSTREVQANIAQAKAISWSDLKNITDFVFIALHGGPGENGIVQGTLEMLGLPYNGPSVFASALCMDKYKTGQFLRAQGFQVPQSLLLSKEEWQQKNMESVNAFTENVGFPCIVKPHDDGCSVMVFSPKNEQELQEALQAIFMQKQSVLLEERIFGMELTVGVVGNENPRALAPSESVAKAGILSSEEKFLPGAGENQTPARLSPEDIALVQKTVKDAYVAMTCAGYSRIDCFFQTAEQSPTGKKRVVILECNTLPALTPATCLFHQAAEEGLRPMDLLDEIVQLGFQAHQQDEVVSVDQILQSHKQL
ncbi:MAG: ATP-grasp domain-containing protein [Candidatus Babeliales bacterium]|jgi:D-alanine-D-alanine ligase